MRCTYNWPWPFRLCRDGLGLRRRWIRERRRRLRRVSENMSIVRIECPTEKAYRVLNKGKWYAILVSLELHKDGAPLAKLLGELSLEDIV